jgi:hypothetical protein
VIRVRPSNANRTKSLVIGAAHTGVVPPSFPGQTAASLGGRLNTLIHAGKHLARQLIKARILLKTDTSEAGETWSDSQIAAALDTSVDTVARPRQPLVEV